jgi:hypothetical protein
MLASHKRTLIQLLTVNTAHTEVLCQLLQAQQRMAQQLQLMPLMQLKIQPSKPCSPEEPTQRDINAIVGTTQLLEGQNSMLNQMVYDIIQGRYGKPYQNSLANSLSQSLSALMVEQARLFSLLEEYVNRDQTQASDSILPPSRLPMDIRAEEKANRGNKRVLSEIDVSEWEIICTETRPRESKRRCDASKTTQLPVGKTPSRATKLKRKKERKRLRLTKKAQQQISKPGDLPPRLCYPCGQPGHYRHNCPTRQHQGQNLGAARCAHGENPIFQGKPDRLNVRGTTSVQEPLPLSCVISNLGTGFFLRGVGCDAPGFQSWHDVPAKSVEKNTRRPL